MRFLILDNKINTSLYYNYDISKIENNFNNFFNEPSLKNNHISDLRKLHKNYYFTICKIFKTQN